MRQSCLGPLLYCGDYEAFLASPLLDFACGLIAVHLCVRTADPLGPIEDFEAIG